MRKQYPTFIVDRGGRSSASRFSTGFVVCTDPDCGFVATAYELPEERRAERLTVLAESGSVFAQKTAGRTTYVLEVLKFAHDPVPSPSRVPSLLRRALSAYIYGAAE